MFKSMSKREHANSLEWSAYGDSTFWMEKGAKVQTGKAASKSSAPRSKSRMKISDKPSVKVNTNLDQRRAGRENTRVDSTVEDQGSAPVI